MKKILFLLICFLVWSKNAFSQTTLSPGDISLLWFSSITGQTAPDEFGFITFVDLSPGTLIYFTDNGVSSAGVLDGGEQLMVYTVNSVISAGTVISFNGSLGVSGNGTFSGSAMTGLSSAGDQVVVFQDSDGPGGSAPQNNPSYIHILNSASRDKGNNCDFTDSNETNAPPSLTPVTFGDGQGTFLALGTGIGCDDENDQLYYNGGTSFPDAVSARASILDPDNWVGTGTVVTIPPPAYFNAKNSLISAGDLIANCVDAAPPTITCPNMQTRTVNVSCNYFVENFTSLATGVTDDCGPVTITQSPAAGSNLLDPGNTSVTLTATDASNNSTTCTFTLTLNDVTPPSLFCNNSTQFETLNANCEASLSNYTSFFSGGDNCDVNLTITQSPAPGTAISSNTSVTLTATDASGNSTTCTFTVELEDFIAPSITCPGTQTQTASADCTALILDYTGLATVSDNCDATPTVEQNFSPGTAITDGTTVTLTVFDASNNTNTCTFTVELEDNLAPIINCPPTQQLNLDAACQVALIDYTGFPFVFDACDGNPTVTQSPIAGTTVSSNTNVTLVATDVSGNSASCILTVDLKDFTGPSISCPGTQSINANASCQALLTDYSGLITASDNCDANLTITQIPNSGTTIVSNTTVTMEAIDDAGNSNSCSFTVEVNDRTAPSISCPGTQSVTANASCQATLSSYTGLAVVNDNCDANPIIIQRPGIGTTITDNTGVLLIVTDASGNSTSCTFTVEVNENTLPDITCPSNQMVAIDGACQGILSDYTSLATASDLCDANPVITQFPASGTSFSESAEVDLIVTDASGNSNSCTFTVQGVDNAPPTLTCPDTQTEFADASCQINLLDYTSIATVTDNCDGGPEVTQSPDEGTPFSSSTTVTLTATDFTGNSTSCTFTVQPGDNTPPSITCPGNSSLDGDASCQAALLDYTSLASATDNCDASLTITQSPVAGTIITSSTTVTLTATDASSNSTTCTFTVSINDNTPPGVTCPDTQTETVNVSCLSNLGDYRSLGIVNDNCDPNAFVFRQIPDPGSIISGTTTVTLFASDVSTNSASCTFTVELTDATPPSLSCPGQFEEVDAACQATLSDYSGLIGLSDNCDGSPTLIQSPSVGTTISSNTAVTLTATDASGNSTSCSFTVVLIDATPPSLTCPGNQTESADANCDATLSDYTSLATASDNCDATPTVTQSPAAGTIISSNTTITLTATDASGNSTSCTFTVELDDNTPPVITCQSAISIDLDANGEAGIPLDFVFNDILISGMDNCGFDNGRANTNAPNFNCSTLGVTPVRFFFFDVNGNQSFCDVDITINDPLSVCNSAPSAVCQNLNLTADANCQANAVAADFDGGSSDPDGDNLTFSVSPVGPYGIGTTNVVLTVSDGTLSSTCNATVTVVDETAPSITCPATQSETADANCEATLGDYTGLATASDNCDANPMVTQSPLAGTTFSSNTTVTLSATDASGNSTTCTFTVELDDITAPSITCPGNQSEPGNANSEATLSDYTSLAVTNDNCDANPMVTQSPAPGTTFTGSTTVSLSVTDASSNINACSFTVVASDVTAPTITCPVTQSESADGNCEATLSDYTSLATVNDNNDQNPTVTQSPASGTTISSNTTVTLTATDASGNSASCTFTVEIDDTTAPSITCPGTQSEKVDTNCLATLVDYTSLAIVSDNCDANPIVTQSPVAGTTISSNTTVTLTATDASGNSNTCTFTVELDDITAPSITCPGNQSEPGNANSEATLSDYTSLAVTNDNCDANPMVTQSPAPGTTFTGSTTVSLSVTDASSNINACSFTVVASDVTAPTITCPVTQSESADGNCEATLSDYTSLATVNDNNDQNPTVTQSPASGTTISSNTTVTLTATDASGNSNTCTFTVELDDNTPPTISCPAAITIECGASTDPSNTGSATGSDNCNLTITFTDVVTPGACSQGASIERTWKADDGSGNMVTCVQIITINDPVVDCSTISNLAVNGTASQSSTYSSGAAGFANDDNLTGDNPNGASANLQHTQDADFQSWWEVDLGQLSDVQNVRIYNRTTSSSFLLGRLNNFWVFISAQPFSGSLQDIINDPNIKQFFFDGSAGSIENIALSGVGRYVRVQKSGIGPLHMAEVQVNGCEVNSTPINVPPTAAFTATPNNGFTPLDVDFDATASFDPDGNITNYAWDFGDGNSGSGQMTAHTYTSAGTYTVELTVTDDDGAINTTTQTVIVSDPVGPCSNISNLAINGTASQSSTYSNGLALYANDGDLTGDDPHGANLQHTNNGEQEPWWEVDLGQQADIQDISIYNRTTSNAFLLGRLSDFWVFISAQPFSGSLQSLINDSSIDKYFFSGSAGSVENITLSGLGRYVRIQKEGSGPLHMSEVQVNGCIDGNPPNIPPTAAFTANPTSGEAPLNVAFDAAASFDPDGTITTYFWDFGDGNTDTGVTTSNSYAAGTYSVTLTVTDNDGDTDTATETITVVEPNQGCGITANLALNGTASQSSTYGSGVASLANDGNTGGNNPNGATADLQHTQDADDESWWEVDLGQPSDIEGIRIYNRASTVPFLLNRLNNFWVFISDQPLVDDLQTNVNNASIAKFFFSGNAGTVEDIALTGIGRYVRVQKTGNGPLHMSEVEVNGCPIGSTSLKVNTTLNRTNLNVIERVRNRSIDTNNKVVLKAAPNPFNHNLILDIQGALYENATIRVLDALGKNVFQTKLNGVKRLDIGNEFTAGVYWIQLLDNGEIINLKVVKSGF